MEDRMPALQVFISYAHSDWAFADWLERDLLLRKYGVWKDRGNLRNADVWTREIQSAIDESAVFVAVLSPDAIASPWVTSEFLYAMGQRKPIIPLMIRPLDRIPFEYSAFHLIDYMGRYDQCLADLLASLVRIESGQIPTSLLEAGNVVHDIKLNGAGSVLRIFEAARSHFEGRHSGTSIRWPDAVPGLTGSGIGTNSLQGLLDLAGGAVHVAAVDADYRDFKEARMFLDFVDHRICVQPIVVVVSSDLKETVRNLALHELFGIFTRQYRSWSELGGPAQDIVPISRAKGSGVRATFERYIMQGVSTENLPIQVETTKQFVAVMARTMGGIGYMAYPYLKVAPSVLDETTMSLLSPITLNGVGPDLVSLNNGSYQLWSYAHAYTRADLWRLPENSIVTDLLEYVSTDDYQNTEVAAQGFYPLTAMTEAALSSHP